MALLDNFVAIICVLSNISFPGPAATQYFACPSQVLETKSHSFPVVTHLGPRVLGETSPKLVEANAPTNRP